MLTTSKTHQKTWPIMLTVAVTLIIWLGSKWYFQDWFLDPFKYPAKAASLSATVLMCWCILLSTRFRPLECFLGGLDKVYQIHKRLGQWSFFLILFHPLFLSAHNLPDLITFLRELLFRQPEGSRYLRKQWGRILNIKY